MVGPLIKQSNDDMMKNLQEKDADLYNWLEVAADGGEKIIYITIGSECVWQQWEVDAIYHGIQDLNKT